MNKKVLLFFTFVIFFVALSALAFFYFYILQTPNAALRKVQVSIGNKTFEVEVANTAIERMRGLSGRDSLGENDGMFFVFDKTSSSYGFWMKDMKFPIDIIWINGGRVIGFSENVVPELGKPAWSLKIYYPPDAVDRVLEVNAGAVKKYDIKIGDQLTYKIN